MFCHVCKINIIMTQCIFSDILMFLNVFVALSFFVCRSYFKCFIATEDKTDYDLIFKLTWWPGASQLVLVSRLTLVLDGVSVEVQ